MFRRERRCEATPAEREAARPLSSGVDEADHSTGVDEAHTSAPERMGHSGANASCGHRRRKRREERWKRVARGVTHEAQDHQRPPVTRGHTCQRGRLHVRRKRDRGIDPRHIQRTKHSIRRDDAASVRGPWPETQVDRDVDERPGAQLGDLLRRDPAADAQGAAEDADESRRYHEVRETAPS